MTNADAPITYEMWVRTELSSGWPFSGWFVWNTRSTSAGKIGWTVDGYQISANGLNYSVGSSFRDGDWLHIVVALENRKGKLYINGSFVLDLGTTVTGYPPATLYSTGNGMAFGYVGIYDRVMNPEQVKANCNALEYRYTASDDICSN